MDEENFEEALMEFAERVENLSVGRPNDVDLVEFIENFHEFDLNFDELSLVKMLKNRLGQEITIDLSNEEAVKKFQKSPKFVKFKQKTYDFLVQHAGQMPPNSVRQRASSDFNGSDLMNSSYSWMSSSPYGQSTLFVGKNVLKRCLAILETPSSYDEQDLKTKRDVLHELSTMRSSDVASQSEHWTQLQTVLVDLLNDEDLFADVLRLIVKLFNCQTHSIVVDVYEILVRNLQQFCDRNGTKTFRLDDGLNLEHRSTLVYLTKFSLFISLISAFPSFWTRYSDELVSRVVEKTFQFLSLCKDTDESIFNPLLATALFDSDGKWLQFLMFSTFSRSRSIAVIKNDERFFAFVLDHFLNHADDARTTSDDKNSKSSSWTLPSVYQPIQLKSLLWSQCCRTLTAVVQYDEARKFLFPAKIGENEIDFQTFFRRYVDVWLSGTIKNAADVKFMSASVLKMSLCVKNHPIFLFTDVVSSLADAVSSSTSTSQDDRSTILSIFNEILTVSSSFRKLFTSDVALKNSERSILGPFLIRYCSKVINLAYQKDPDAPLNLVYAAVRLCTTLCRFDDGRRTIFSTEYLISDVVRLAKDKTLSTDYVFPLLTSCERRSDVKKYLYNSFNFSSRQCFLWSTPLDYPCGNLIQKFSEYIRIVAKCQSSSSNDRSPLSTPFGLIRQSSADGAENYDHEIDSVFSNFFIFLAQPSALRELSTNQTFVAVVDTSFAHKSDENSSTFVMRLIRLGLCDLNFLLAFRRRTDQGNKLKSLLEKNFFTDDREFQITPRSLLMLDIYSRQKVLAGPSERPTTFDVDSAPFDVGVLFDSSCFRAEPSCFFIAKTSPSSTIDVQNEDYLTFFINAVESKQRICHSDLLLQFFSNRPDASDSQMTSRLDSGETHCGTESGWSMILEYGENLKIFDDLRKSTIELKNVLRFVKRVQSKMEASSSDDSVDWFVGVTFLINDGRSAKTVQFLSSLNADSNAVSVLWPSMSSNFRNHVLDDVTPIVERLCESTCPSILSCLHRNGVALSNLLLIWLQQSFINFLDYPEIVNFVSLSVLGGRTFVIFFCCCVLKHLSSLSVSVQFHARNLPAFLSNGYNFRLHNYIADLKRFRELYETL